MAVSAQVVKELREKTGAGMMDCKTALDETGGDFGKAEKVLRKKGLASAAKKASRAATEGLVDSYIHMGGKIGVLVEVNCETDFVARTEDFQALVKDVAMHIAARRPARCSARRSPPTCVATEMEIYTAQARATGSRSSRREDRRGQAGQVVRERRAHGPALREGPEKTVDQLRRELVAKIGENIEVRRFARFQLGERPGMTLAGRSGWGRSPSIGGYSSS